MADAIGGGASTDAPDAAEADSADADAAGSEPAVSADESHPAASSGPSRSAGSADQSRVESLVGVEPGLRRERLRALAGAAVRASDDEFVGRVRDIYLHDATGELAAITVVRRQLSSRNVLIPVSAIAVLPAEHTAPGETDAAQVASNETAYGAAGIVKGKAKNADKGKSKGKSKSAGKDKDANKDKGTNKGRDKGKGAGKDASDESDEAGHPQAVWLLVDAETARAGIHPPETSHASPEMLREAERALGLQEASAG